MALVAVWSQNIVTQAIAGITEGVGEGFERFLFTARSERLALSEVEGSRTGFTEILTKLLI
jgi:hypothetical protein